MRIHHKLPIILTLVYWATSSVAHSLPAASRTAFKCEVDGKVTYSDSPCLGAKKVDLEPTRGLNSGSGKEQLGPDVQREREREVRVEALRPITGMDSKQLDAFGRRLKMQPELKQACLKLDREIPAAEAAEKSASKEALAAAQSKLLALRSKYRELQC